MDYNRFTYELQARNFPVSKSRRSPAPHQSPATHQPPPQVGRGTYRLPTGSAHADGGATRAKKRVSLGLHPVSLGKHQRNGVESQHRPSTTSQRIGAHAESQRKGGTLFAPFTCAPFSWAEVFPPCCQFHPISLLLLKETGWSPKETRFWVPPRQLFGPARLSHGLEAPTSQPTASS